MINMNSFINNGSAIDDRKITFTWYDYTLFVTMLVMSVLIGIFFGCFGKKQSSAQEYLLGGRTMKAIPIAMSLVASQISGVAILGIATDTYLFGTNYWISCISVFLVCLVTCYVYLPVFHKLQLTSTYEYLQMRFDTKVRSLASFLFGLHVLLHLPIVIYAPALALEQVTDINIHLITPFLCAICIFYTTIGGLKAVVWTDLLQFSVTIGAMVVVLYMGVYSAGGLGMVFQNAHEGERLQIDFNMNPTVRDTFWAIVIGWSVNSLTQMGVSQSCVQKFMAVPTLREAKIANILYTIGCIFVKTSCIIIGLIIYTTYKDCDPMSTSRITKPDQLVPYYVLDASKNVPGLSGLFIAGIFCASLSTLSASMNCLAGTVYEDFLSRLMPKTLTDVQISNILKVLVVIIGSIGVGFVYVIQHLGGLLPISISFTGVASGPILGLFTLGMMFPKANAKGAFIGAITAISCIGALFVGVQYYKAKGFFTYVPKPLSTDNCDYFFTPKNTTVSNLDIQKQTEEIFFIFRITYYYYSLIGASICVIVGNIVSYFSKDDAPPVHRDLLSPVIHRFLDEEKSYYSVEKAINMVTYNDEKGLQ